VILIDAPLSNLCPGLVAMIGLLPIAGHLRVGVAPISAIRSGRPTPPKRTFPYALWSAGMVEKRLSGFWSTSRKSDIDLPSTLGQILPVG
jgi:hypothetical protein